MDIFGDKIYDKLDWITKATEPIEYYLNEKLGSLPTEIEVTIDDFVNAVKNSNYLSYYMDTRRVLLCALNRVGFVLSDKEFEEILPVYVFDIKDTPVINFENLTLSGGTIKLIKTKDVFSEEELKKKMGSNGYYILGHIEESAMQMDRLNEILDLLNSSEGLKKRSVSGKVNELRKAYRDIMSTNKWNIRSVDLSNKVATWIKAYVEKGDLASMTNFCKLKAMTHRGYPIYNIEEEQ